PRELDRVVARCLAKISEERFESCEALAKSLYPFCRSRQRPSWQTKKTPSWWAAPVRRRDVWRTAFACLFLALFVQAPRTLNAHFGIPPAPAHPYFHPGVPYEAY